MGKGVPARKPFALQQDSETDPIFSGKPSPKRVIIVFGFGVPLSMMGYCYYDRSERGYVSSVRVSRHLITLDQARASAICLSCLPVLRDLPLVHPCERSLPRRLPIRFELQSASK